MFGVFLSKQKANDPNTHPIEWEKLWWSCVAIFLESDSSAPQDRWSGGDKQRLTNELFPIHHTDFLTTPDVKEVPQYVRISFWILTWEYTITNAWHTPLACIIPKEIASGKLEGVVHKNQSMFLWPREEWDKRPMKSRATLSNGVTTSGIGHKGAFARGWLKPYWNITQQQQKTWVSWNMLGQKNQINNRSKFYYGLDDPIRYDHGSDSTRYPYCCGTINWLSFLGSDLS